MRTEDLVRLLEGVTLTSEREQTMARHFTDSLLDRCEAAYRAEHDRWCWRRKPNNSGFQLVRDTSPKGDINAEEYQDITNLTKRECRDSDDAESWLNTYRGRASIAAVLGVLADRQSKIAQRNSRPKRDPLRNNPVVGFMREEQAERILAEMREERCRNL